MAGILAADALRGRLGGGFLVFVRHVLRDHTLRGFGVMRLGAQEVGLAGFRGVAVAGGFARVLAGFLGAGFLFLDGDQAFAVGDRDLVVVRMDLGEGEEAVPVAAIFDEGGLQARLDADDLGEIDVALELLLRGCLDIVIFEAVTVQHDDAGFLRVCRVDQHTF